MAVKKRKRRKNFEEFQLKDRFLLPIDGPDGPLMFFLVVGEGREDGESCWMAEMPRTGVRMYLSKSLEDDERKIGLEELSDLVRDGLFAGVRSVRDEDWSEEEDEDQA